MMSVFNDNGFLKKTLRGRFREKWQKVRATMKQHHKQAHTTGAASFLRSTEIVHLLRFLARDVSTDVVELFTSCARQLVGRKWM